ncbi:MAG: MFS transporter [Candidatus Gracilibacteria bacterium]
MKKSNIFILFLIVFLDLIGVGILIPILAPLMLDTTSQIVPTAWNEATRNMALGLLVASYPLAQFFGAPILGTLSDRHGRKKILAISLFGTLIGYVLFAIGILTNQLWLLFVSRTLDGFTGGNLSIANSSIADMNQGEKSAKNFGLIGMAFGMGFIVGPFLGGILSDPHLVSWFNHATPFWFAAILSMANLILVGTSFKETIAKKVHKHIHPFIGFTHLAKAWRMKELRIAFIVTFLHNAGFAFFAQFFPVFLVQKFAFEPSQIGTFFGYIGICIALSQGFVTRIVGKYVVPEKVLKFSLLGLSFTLVAMTLPQAIWILYLLQASLAIFEGLSFPNSTAIISNLATSEDQGEVLGITQSLRALGQALPPLIAGVLITFGQNLPTLVSAGIILLAWGIFVIFFRKLRFNT